MEQEERVIPAEVINELLGLDAKNPLTLADLYSDDDETKREAQKSLLEIKSFLRNSGFDDDESEVIIYKLQRYNSPQLVVEDDSEEKDVKQMAIKGGALLAISLVAGFLWWQYNKHLYYDKHVIWYLPAIANALAVVGIIIGGLLLFTAFSGGVANSLSTFIERISTKFRSRKKEKHSRESGFHDYAKYLMENHHYSKANVRFFFSDYGLDDEEMRALLDSL